MVHIIMMEAPPGRYEQTIVHTFSAQPVNDIVILISGIYLRRTWYGPALDQNSVVYWVHWCNGGVLIREITLIIDEIK